MQIRELRPDDWPLWKDARLRALADSPDAFGRTLEEEMGRTDEEWRERLTWPSRGRVNLIAEIEDRPMGLAASYIDPDDEALAGIFAMWVDPSARSRGVGRALLERALSWARSQGAGTVELSVTEGNTPAHELYRRAGFIDTGRREELRPGSPLQIIYMRREVRA